MKRTALGIVVLALSAVISVGFVPQSSYDFYQKALTKEKAEGNLEEAIALFQKVVDKGDDEALAAQAQLHIGMCHEKLGLDKAQDSYQKVIDRYPRQSEAVKVAKEKLSVFLRARALIEKGDKEFKITKVHTEKSREGYFSPDGKKLALVDQKGNTLNLWLRDIASGKEVRILSTPGDLHDCFWSPDSQSIAYIDGADNVSIISVEGGRPKTVIEADPKDQKAADYVWPMGWTSDSKKLIVQDSAKGLFAVPASGGKWEEIFRFPDPKKAKEHDEWMTLSPDGKFIAYQSTQGGNQDIYVMPVRGGEPERITDDPATDSWPVWSYDGQWLAFGSARTGHSETWVIRITPDGRPGSQPIQATRGGGGGVWTQDGKIAYSTSKEICPIFAAKADGSEEVQLTKFNNRNVEPRWSPDALNVAFVAPYGEEGQTAVWAVRSNGGDEKFLALGDSPAWSSDGRKIAFSAGTRRPPATAKISIIPAGGGEAQELMNYDGALTNLDWSPDGRSIAFSYSRGKVVKNPIPDSRMDIEDIYIISASGGEPKRLTGMDKKGFRFTSPRWSPDGKKIAFRSLDYEGWEKGRQSEPIGIYTIDIGGGEPKLVTNEFDHWWFCWSPDGKNIIFPKQEKNSRGPYGADRRLHKVSAEGGTPEKLNIMGMMPDFSPDSKKIAFSRLSESNIEFWIVENFLPTEKKGK